MTAVPSKLRAREAREALYRQLVLDAAEEVFAEAGYEAARVQDIVAGSGLSLGTVYAQFQGKAGIFRAVHERRLEDLFRVSAAAIGALGRPTEMLTEGFAVFVRWLVDHPAYLRMHLTEGYSWGEPSRFNTDLQVSAWDRGITMMAGLFQAGIDDGSIRPGDARLMARLTSSAQQVLISAWYEAGMTEDPEALIRRIQDHVARCFFVTPPIDERE